MGDLMARRFQMIADSAEAANLYTGGDLTWTNMYKLDITLPIGVYIFSAAATSTDTDAQVCCVRFMTSADLDASAESESLQYIERSTAGESHRHIYTTTAATDHLYLYASRNWPLGQGDTVTFRNIRIERIG